MANRGIHRVILICNFGSDLDERSLQSGISVANPFIATFET